MRTMTVLTRTALAACAALVLACAAPSARADDAITYPELTITYPDPEPISYPSGPEDGAFTTAERDASTLTTLSGDVNFEVDSATLTARAKEVLDGLAAEWKDTPPSSVEIVGHTDSVADDAYNQTLSEERAKSVSDYLTAKIPGLKVTTSGKGESEPIADNEDEAGRAKNRRVEITAKQ